MKALRPQLIIVTALLLAVFLMLIGLTLDRAFYVSVEKNLATNLNTQLTLLLASTEVPNHDDVDMSSRLLNTSYSLPASGLYGFVLDSSGRVLWKSLSTASTNLPAPKVIEAGDQLIDYVEDEGSRFVRLVNGVQWYVADQRMALSFNIYRDLTAFDKEISEYRRTLWGWLFVLAAILLPAQMLLLLWMLTPLHRVVDELNAIEEGKQASISGNYPREIRRLTNNINELLEHEHRQQSRYRNALADLAHSLKTPLATLNSSFNDIKDSAIYPALQEQIQRMDKIIGHQLQRAATAGESPTRKLLKIHAVVQKLVQALDKVYRSKQIQFDVQIADDFAIRVDEGDFMEVMGNLLDNACKFCQQQIQITTDTDSGCARIIVADDGVGVAQDQLETILQRGGRLDQTIPGQGIGLSVANEIVQAYRGSLHVEQGELGGAAFILELPTA